MLYGSEIVDWEPNQIMELEKIQAKSLRTLLGADIMSNKAALRLMCGIEPLGARFDFAKLNYFFKVSNSNPDSLLGELHSSRNRQEIPQSYYKMVRRLLDKYGLSEPGNLSRSKYLKMIKNKIWSSNVENDISEALNSKCGQSLFTRVFLADSNLVQLKTYAKYPILDLEFDLTRRRQLCKIMRFWTCPMRPHTCSCGTTVTQICDHLAFDCNNPTNKKAMNHFLSNIDQATRPVFYTDDLPHFIKTSLCSDVEHGGSKFYKLLHQTVSKLEF